MGKKGRKSYWSTRIEPRLTEIAGWCRDGYTDKMICRALGVSAETFCKYKREKAELVEALKVNKQIADLTVENSLYKRAVGYSYTETVKEVKTDKDDNIIFKHIKKVEKMVVPDTTAQIFWLKNRKQKEWRDKQEIENSDKESYTFNVNFGRK
ncbi:MAG: transposase [Spirochaetes bacterium]|nr:transposase [Spirochaetota bacterium]